MRVRFQSMALTAAFCGSLVFSYTAFAQSDKGRYRQWNTPNPQTSSSSNVELKNLLKDLKAMIKDAEQARAADRMFLQDLKALAARFENPWTVRAFFDDFKDGDYTRSPQWSVRSGEYWVEQGYGLRNKTIQAAAPAQSKKSSREQLAFSILGAVLNGNKPKAVSAPPPQQRRAKAASIQARARISNAFSLSTNISSWAAQGRFEIGLTQGTAGSGYRLSYGPGATNGSKATLELLKVTMRGQSVIESTTLPSLEDKRTHTISWTRKASGNMAVSIDGNAVLQARDSSFRDAFSGLQFTSDGADVIVKSISVMGMR